MSFNAVVTRDERVLVSHDGHQAGSEDAEQLVLAKATGNPKRGNER